jgi:energy-coupling factor transporter ATP-binding protein EcfA2
MAKDKEKKGLTIVEFQAENFMRLKAVRIKPEGTGMVTLTGKNGAGKSSILNAIMAVMDKAALKKQGISKLLREGAERGFVKIDLGSLVAKLTLTQKGEYLTVENSDGLEYKTPATILEKLRGMISFDPLAFSKMDAKKQKDILLGTVDIGLDLDQHDRDRELIFYNRTIVGRKRDELKGKLAGLPPLREDLPAEEIPLSTISEERKVLEETKAANEAVRAEYQHLRFDYQNKIDAHGKAQAEHADIELKIQELRGRQAELVTVAAELAKDVKAIQDKGTTIKAKVEALVDPDFSVLDTRLEELEVQNAEIREAKRREEIRKEFDTEFEKYRTMTTEIEALDKKKTDVLAAAKFPVEGLGFNADGITFNALPFDHASDGEKLTVSVAIGMALNPDLRVLWFNHGEMLDRAHWGIIEKLAGDEDYQVWAEKLDESGTVGVYIEDGEISAINGENQETTGGGE